jgi:hypothetical protein
MPPLDQEADMSMPKAAPPNPARTSDAFALPETFEGATRVMQTQFASAAAIPQAIMQANLSMFSELLMFMGRRAKSQADFYASLGHCKELSEAVEAQREFAEQVTRDYSKEAGQLSDIVRKNVASLTDIGAQCGTAFTGKEKLAA